VFIAKSAVEKSLLFETKLIMFWTLFLIYLTPPMLHLLCTSRSSHHLLCVMLYASTPLSKFPPIVLNSHIIACHSPSAFTRPQFSFCHSPCRTASLQLVFRLALSLMPWRSVLISLSIISYYSFGRVLFLSSAVRCRMSFCTIK